MNAKAKMQKSKQGGVSVAMLILTMVISVVIGSYAYVSVSNQRLTQHAIAYMEAKIIAENAVALGTELFFQKLKENKDLSDKDLLSMINQPDLKAEIMNVAILNKDQLGYSMTGINFKLVRNGRINNLTVTAGTENEHTDTQVAIESKCSVQKKSILDYAYYVKGPFELFPAPLMAVHGDVRCDGGIMRLSTVKGLSFDGKVWASDGLDVTDRNDITAISASKRIAVNDLSGTPQNFYDEYNSVKLPLDSDHPNWDSKSVLRWGADMVRDDAPSLEIPIDTEDTHLLIEPVDSNDSPSLKREKISRVALKKHGITIKVDRNNTIWYKKGNGGFHKINPTTDEAIVTKTKDANGVYTMTGDGWVSVDNTFVDKKETGKKVKLVNIYMDKLIQRFENAKVVYIQVEDSKGSIKPYLEDRSVSMPAVRIRNGNDLSAASEGITVATHRLTYIEGNYNKKDKVPALVAADNLKVLSNNWDDKNKSNSIASRIAKDTWYQMAVLVGGYEYQQSAPSGAIQGLQNLIRFPENWSKNKKTFHFLGSNVRLFASKETDSDAKGTYPPQRDVRYDEDLKNVSPPGTPDAFSAPEVTLWSSISWKDVHWD